MSTWFSWLTPQIGSSSDELPSLYPLGLSKDDFVKTDVVNTFQMILTDTVERTQGIPEEISDLLWDNCLQNEQKKGLITLLSEAMTDRTDLFLVYDPAIGVLRKATDTERATITADYELRGESPVGVYISFREFKRAELIRIYSALEYLTVSGLNKALNLSTAIQFKVNDLRGSVALVDAEVAKTQAKRIATALANGKDVALDSKDLIELLAPNLEATKASMEFLNEKKSFYLKLPASYISGLQTGGIGSTGEADQKAIERGLKSYFVSIIKPVLKAIFDLQVSYKSQDFRMIDQGLKALQTFELIENEALISQDERRLIVSGLFGLEDSENADL
jgi:hypothetical protein